MLPFTYHGVLSVAANTAEPSKRLAASSYLSELSRALRDAKARDIDVAAASIAFRGGLLRPAMSWNLLVAIDRGSVTVDPDGATVTFELRFHELIVVAAMLSMLISVPMLLRSPTSGALAALLLFMVFAGGNIALAVWRMRRLLVFVMTRAT